MRETMMRHLPSATALSAALLLISGVPGWAMDCTRATSPVDKAICADAGSRTQDATLSRLYFATLRTLSGPRHATLIEDQRRWLKERAESCEQAAGGAPACVEKTTAARIAQITACYGGPSPNPAAGGVMCAAAAHASCPRFSVSASASIWAYPFLVAKIRQVAAATAGSSTDADACAPESGEHPGTPDQNDDDYTMILEGAGSDWVTVRWTEDADFRGAAHPGHGENAATYEASTGKVFPITRLMPGLKTSSEAAQSFRDAIDAHVDWPCCDDNEASDLDDGDAGDVGTDAADHHLPTAWSIEPDGGLKVYYPYAKLGRTFVATSVLKRSEFITWVEPKYRSLFAARH